MTDLHFKAELHISSLKDWLQTELDSHTAPLADSKAVELAFEYFVEKGPLPSEQAWSFIRRCEFYHEKGIIEIEYRGRGNEFAALHQYLEKIM